MGINFAYARKKFSEAQQKLRKEYKAAGMTEEQILEMYEYDLHQFNRDLAYQRHTQRLGILEEPDMEEEGHDPLLHKFIDALTVYQQPTEDAKLWWLDEIEDTDLIKSLMRLTDDELDLIDKLGERCRTDKSIYYTMDFDVTPHLLRHTYITNLIHEGVDPKTVQYLAGHENSKVTMDIYAKVKYNKPWELASVINQAFSTNSEKESA